MKKDKIYYEAGHGLVWAEFRERGCPMKKEDYFLTKKEILNLDIVRQLLHSNREEVVREIIEIAEQILVESKKDKRVGDCGDPHCSHQLSLFIGTVKKLYKLQGEQK